MHACYAWRRAVLSEPKSLRGKLMKRFVALGTILALLLSTAIFASGPLTYTVRTDLTAAAETVPTLCTPAPCKMTSNDLNAGTVILRSTDANTVLTNDEFATPGSAVQREWNSDSTVLSIQNFKHGVNNFLAFNPATQTTAIVPCTFVGANCWNGKLTTINGSVDGPMSGTQPYVYYSINSAGTAIQKMDFTATIANSAVADTDTNVAILGSCSGIPTITGTNELTDSLDDTRFLAPAGGGGTQDNWSLVYVFDKTQGCRWLNLSNFTVSAWGGVSISDANYFDETGGSITAQLCSQIHNARISLDGRWATISTQCFVGGASSGYIYFWDIDTNNVYRDAYTNTGSGPYYGGGHNAVGFNNIYVNVDTNFGGLNWFSKHVLPPLSTPTWLTSSIANAGFDDSHISWSNQGSGQLQPFIVSLYQTTAPSQAWGDEIIGVSPGGSGPTYRFTHMFTRAHDFNSQGIANVSRDGKWVAWCSDWTAARDDVYIAPMPTAGSPIPTVPTGSLPLVQNITVPAAPPAPVIKIAPATVNGAILGVPFSQQFTATGCAAACKCSVATKNPDGTPSALPTGLTLTPGCLLSGIIPLGSYVCPTNAACTVTTNFTIQAQ